MAPEVIDRGLRGYSYPVSPCSLAASTGLAAVICTKIRYVLEKYQFVAQKQRIFGHYLVDSEFP